MCMSFAAKGEMEFLIELVYAVAKACVKFKKAQNN